MQDITIATRSFDNPDPARGAAHEVRSHGAKAMRFVLSDRGTGPTG